jgi:5-methylcytosine-specific restriction endonuclease McrA
MKFEYFADKKYFAQLMSDGNCKELLKYRRLFDFRDPSIKRKEFNAKRHKIYSALLKKYGRQCLLNLNDKCTQGKNLVIDHFIPISSNELNKKLRHLKPHNGKKVQTQSFGSNNIANLILACGKCNGFKKHKIPTKEMWEKLKNFI